MHWQRTLLGLVLCGCFLPYLVPASAQTTQAAPVPPTGAAADGRLPPPLQPGATKGGLVRSAPKPLVSAGRQKVASDLVGTLPFANSFMNNLRGFSRMAGDI